MEDAFLRLARFVRQRDYRGPDPFDGLAGPLAALLDRLPSARTLRLALTQFAKHSPIDLRRPLGIPRLESAKGLALFLGGLLSRYRTTGDESYLEEARRLGQRLTDLAHPDRGGWGYPFPWQGRGHFLATGTPNLVVTSFVGEALLDLAEATDEPRWGESALAGARFLTRDLVREGPRLVYFPDPTVFVHNANLLGAAYLARAARRAGTSDFQELARAAAMTSVRALREDGTWPYGESTGHAFVDCFHTAYNLLALDALARHLETDDFEPTLGRATRVWFETFFDEGRPFPRFEAGRVWPADTHSLSVALVTLLVLSDRNPGSLDRSDRLVGWMLDHMRRHGGPFLYRRYGPLANPIPYMRWTQAWAFLALALHREHRPT